MSSKASQRDDLAELREHFARGDRILVLHYACENLYGALDHPPAVSCIAYCPVGSGNAGWFSCIDAPGGVADGAEKWVLAQYYDFLQKNSTAIVVHWNMSKADYGFAALSARYRFLFGEDEPYKVPADRTFDLDDLVAAEYGAYYVGHPRLIKLAAVNQLTRQHALSGKDEADRFANGDHGAVRRSTDEKVRWIAVLAEQFLSGSLTTDRSVGSVAFANGHLDAVQTVVELARRARDVHRELLRRHGARPTIELNDEYDDQDFFRGLLRVFFDDVRPEDYVPSYAGANSRVDFLLPAVKLALELKHTRGGMDAKRLGEELIVDVERYGNKADIRHLVCVVFDYDGLLANPRGLEADFSRELKQEGIGVTVVILDR